MIKKTIKSKATIVSTACLLTLLTACNKGNSAISEVSDNLTLTPTEFITASITPTPSPAVDSNTVSEEPIPTEISNNLTPSITLTPQDQVTPAATLIPEETSIVPIPESNPSSDLEPTTILTQSPTITLKPTSIPTQKPATTSKPTSIPTQKPTITSKPTSSPTQKPTITLKPTSSPDLKPIVTSKPTSSPTQSPTVTPKPTKPIVPTKGPDLKDSLSDMSLEEIIEKVYENITEELPIVHTVEITKENSNYYLGIPEMEFEEAIASEAMMRSIPYSACLVRVAEGSDIEALKKDIAESVNPYKWICVGVDPANVLVGNIGNVIFLIMSNNIPQEIMNSFLSLQPDTASNVISKEVSPDENGLIYYKDYVSKALEPYQEKSVLQLADKIHTIYDQYLKGQENVYYSIIPDKSFYITNSSFSMEDYYEMIAVMQQNITCADYIPILPLLELSDYYKTDLHWKQEELFPVIHELGNVMGFTVSENDFTKHELKHYQGVYSSYLQEIPDESLYYLTSPATENAEVTIFDTKGTSKIYHLDQWNGSVPYNLFLGGPNPLITITNPNLKNGKELIIFGDSFTSSLAPLLTGAYEKITLVDLRFVMSSYLSEVMEFNEQDVLFLYNTAIINNSFMLK